MAVHIAPLTGPSPKTSASPPPLSTSLSSSAVRSVSPQPPPASPLTPPAQPAKFATTTPPVAPIQRPQPPQLIEQPPSLPFSSHESSDAIALRAAISSLQFQRLQAQRDLRTLEDIKRQAVERPEEYRQHSYPTSYGSMLLSRSTKTTSQSSRFTAVPLPQDVVRCPPIEWAKYNIIGESLDKLHNDQQVRPGDLGSSQRESVVAAPYNPFLDKLNPRPVSETTPSTRKDSGSSASDQNAQRKSSKPTV
ncbi:hypothetical protein M436DRAFT_41102 [Aureobasidium namibiae CBS 147.97]|uniref:Uncharacterized protein n=1 Tax=Aureobasidium namibiae CBS 147.97 TaxID=1043004 RepID=A0A074WR55_9PEZI|nr:uncharacterized protein M436DRAFT_41102 [Aureobasidium namibiae CBS 147.97]KEQ75635.1 hypothetical protein M436DRAFT_41102 [Aureobasidium namibiae CBS 147.97]